jgi:hypothetical protein
MAQPNPPNPGKMDQLKNTGKKAADQMKNIAGEAGEKLKSLLANNNKAVQPGKLSDIEIKNQKMENQVLFFTFLFIGILGFIGLVFASKTFRVYTTLHKLEMYRSNEINQKSIYDIYTTDDQQSHKLRDFYVASAYRPYVCFYHKYDYCSLEVFREVLRAGPRFIELEIFNDSFSVDVEPVVSVGSEDGEWKYALNTLMLGDVLKVIAGTVFNVKYLKDLHKDPFIIYLNLKVNRNVICLEKIHKYIYNILGHYLLDLSYSFNSTRDNDFTNIPLSEIKKKIVIMASPGFEGSALEEIVNYSTISNHTLENNPEQYRIMYLKNGDIVEKDEDIEEYSNTTFFKIKSDNLKEYNKCGISILSPESNNSGGFFEGVTPYNPEPSRGLEAGCQFIMMNYQRIDTNMSNYTYIFKDSSFVLKADSLKHSDNNSCNRKFSSIKTQKIEHTKSELNYTYATPKDDLPEND